MSAENQAELHENSDESPEKKPCEAEFDWKNKENEFEELFEHRYTENDPDFVKTLNKKLPDQPCVYPWFVRDNSRNRNSFGESSRSQYSDRSSGYNSRQNSYGDNRYGSSQRNANYYDRNYHSRRDY